MPVASVIVWFRQDLRLADHPAFFEACRRGGPVIPVYIESFEEEGEWAPGAASRYWLHQALALLDADLRAKGSRLTFRSGPALHGLLELIQETGSDAVFWSRRYEPAVIERDKQVKERLRAAGVEAKSFNSALLFEPWQVQTQQAGPYQVFTPFWKACRAYAEPADPTPEPKQILPPAKWPGSMKLAELDLEPHIDWTSGLRQAWAFGRKGALETLDRFLAKAVSGYEEDRNRPDMVGSSRLSPYLHFGEIGPREIWKAVQKRAGKLKTPEARKSAEVYLSEIGWREFAHHLLYHYPHTTDQPLREKFSAFPWKRSPKALSAWQKGLTGYPIVDAGMRELWATGWMHNRVRMVVASFLVKDLMIPWQSGAKWFWDTLVDANLASNTLGWQWTAGCGADAAPYFRIFNPTSQGRKFDPEGAYVRRWVPELAALPPKWIHCPSEAPSDVINACGVQLGKTYPRPIVDHSEARDAALEAFARLK